MVDSQRNTQRFSDRVENYVRFRPNYPRAIVSFLSDQCGLTRASSVADIGSGTGKSAQLFVDYGCTVLGVEPNRPMRQAAEQLFANQPNFISVIGTAEQSGLADNSADFVIAGQAFHWFDPQPARSEFQRILRPDGYICLIWNERLQSDPFQHAYDQFLHRHAINYAAVNHRNITAERIDAFFAPANAALKTFDYTQSFDFEGVLGRALSSSYTPAPGHPQSAAFVAALRALFDQHQQANIVRFNYETKLFYGRLPR